MDTSYSVESLRTILIKEGNNLGNIKKVAKEIKSNHALAEELWKTKEFQLQMLATLIMDKKVLDQKYMDHLLASIGQHDLDKKHQLLDWLFANQLMKSSKTKNLLNTWQHHKEEDFRRLYWYYQARLRWTGKNPLDNSKYLTDQLKKNMSTETPSVQWMMNFTAGWIGVYEPDFRTELSDLGEQLGLYKDEVVAKGCTPSYLPEFIRIETQKRKQ